MTQPDKDSQAVGRKVVCNLFDKSKGTLHNQGLPNQLVIVSAEAKMKTKFGAAVTYPDEVVVRKQSQPCGINNVLIGACLSKLRHSLNLGLTAGAHIVA